MLTRNSLLGKLSAVSITVRMDVKCLRTTLQLFPSLFLDKLSWSLVYLKSWTTAIITWRTTPKPRCTCCWELHREISPQISPLQVWWEVVWAWMCWLQSFLVQFSVLCHSSTQVKVCLNTSISCPNKTRCIYYSDLSLSGTSYICSCIPKPRHCRATLRFIFKFFFVCLFALWKTFILNR